MTGGRYDVVGVPISVTTKAAALDVVRSSVETGKGGYVCFSNVHTTVTARRSSGYWKILAGSLLTIPDGRPLYWVGKLKHAEPLEHVPGADFMSYVLGRIDGAWARHYFYGSSDSTLAQLEERLRRRFPNVRIVGGEPPPYRPLTPGERAAALERIRASGANLVWVGLGAPKQENWMWESWEALRPAVLLGVGAAFDFHGETVRRCPVWMTESGLEWLHRLAHSPRRLGRRYGVTNAQFIYYLLVDWAMGRPT